ncbi:hypothetical protein BU26DRAFT_168113 [Trematosphaeria pertusa]|uniref:Enolase C-terminal domain-like protein n=1 Tax=Trematosphaeria pertusa TaxID=390896 RepID=A0A6A6HUU1_9PLEO|nr:uncharacterized protein BU26DRAFT_168113 [Trematosphaeria pertusa]KAF2241659.1 hypothetical protein BU26DRAFT_168113 [Trematosphaeria pertusa]
MAKAFGVPCVPHNGAMGLVGITSHLSLIGYIVSSGKKGMLEFAENNRHRVYQKNPAEVRDAHYVTPVALGYSSGYQNDCVESLSGRWEAFRRTRRGDRGWVRGG